MLTEWGAKRLLAKSRESSLFPAPQRVFEITPLVPGSPSLDVRSRSPGGTRRSKGRFEIVDFRFLRESRTRLSRRKSQIGNRQSEINICLSVTVVLKCRKLSQKTRARPQIPTQSSPLSRLRPATVTPLGTPFDESCFPPSKARPLPR